MLIHNTVYSVAKVHPSKGIEMGRKLLRATGGTLSVLSGRNQLGLFFPVLSCLQTVSHNIETGGSKGGNIAEYRMFCIH